MINIFNVDFSDPRDRSDFSELLNHYATDPMGGGESLPKDILQSVCNDLSKWPGAFSFIAKDIDRERKAVGLINCFLNYSTFKAKPILNIHDVIVHSNYRSKGVGTALLSHAQAHAVSIGCCKMTLEVLTGNTSAIKTYEKSGFQNYQLQAENGHAVFLQKWL